MSRPEFGIDAAAWPGDEPSIRAVREAVFVREQGVPPKLEWDGRDDRARHVLARDAQGRAIGTARLLPDGQIGRMAVIADWRGHGVGRALLAALIALARAQGLPRVRLHAQISAVGFYVRHGFQAYGEIYEEAGIPHQSMQRSLD